MKDCELCGLEFEDNIVSTNYNVELDIETGANTYKTFSIASSIDMLHRRRQHRRRSGSFFSSCELCLDCRVRIVTEAMGHEAKIAKKKNKKKTKKKVRKKEKPESIEDRSEIIDL